MTRASSQFLLLGLTFGMALLLWFAWTLPARDALISVAAVVLILVSMAIERVWPHNPSWNHVDRAELSGDVGSLVLIFVVLDGALKWLTPFAVLAVLPASGGLALPLWQEVVLVILWVEMAAWLSHWAHHRFQPLWALHAMHHSTTQLYTLNNFRFHPMNHIINHLAMILPLFLMGISTDAIVIYTALSLPVLLLQHSNVDFDFGALNRVFNTNDLHRWHHSAQPAEGTKNLGRALVIWDQVFGTYLRPKAAARPTSIGLFQSSQSFPAAPRFCAQLIWPFTPACCRKPQT